MQGFGLFFLFFFFFVCQCVRFLVVLPSDPFCVIMVDGVSVAEWRAYRRGQGEVVSPVSEQWV